MSVVGDRTKAHPHLAYLSDGAIEALPPGWLGQVNKDLAAVEGMIVGMADRIGWSAVRYALDSIVEEQEAASDPEDEPAPPEQEASQ